MLPIRTLGRSAPCSPGIPAPLLRCRGRLTAPALVAVPGILFGLHHLRGLMD